MTTDDDDGAKLARVRQIINWTPIAAGSRERQVREIVAVLDGSASCTPPRRAPPDTCIERLTDMVSRLVQSYDGVHDDEECRAYGAGDDGDLPDDPNDADPACTCGATAVRDAARALLVDVDAPSPGAAEERAEAAAELRIEVTRLRAALCETL